MPPIASFHLVRERPLRQPLAMARLAADRPRLSRTPGLQFWRVLGTGRGTSTAIGADLRRTALFAVWDDESALDGFLATSSIAERWGRAEEAWSVRLRGLGGHGTWRGFDVPASLGHPEGRGRDDTGGVDIGSSDLARPVAFVTRAVVRVRHWRTFAAAGRPVSDEVNGAAGLLAVCGIGEAPLGRQATFSVWRSWLDARSFAYRLPHHAEAVRRTRAEGWYGEEMFARFEPYGSTGTWDGRDPLAG